MKYKFILFSPWLLKSLALITEYTVIYGVSLNYGIGFL